MKGSISYSRNRQQFLHGKQAPHGCVSAQVMHAAVKGSRAPPRTWVLQLSRPHFNATADTLHFTVQASSGLREACTRGMPSLRVPGLNSPRESATGHSGQGSSVCEHMDPRRSFALVIRWHGVVAVCRERSLAQVLGPGSVPKYPGGAAAYALANADGSLAAQVRLASGMVREVRSCENTHCDKLCAFDLVQWRLCMLWAVMRRAHARHPPLLLKQVRRAGHGRA